MKVTYETFRGDIEELGRMAHDSWRNEYGADSYPNLYKPSYFNYLFERIADRDHLIAAYSGDRIMAFMAALPRRFHYRGGIYKAVLACLLVTREQAYRKGMALGLTAKALQLNEKHHYDFALLYLETGHRSSKMLAKLKQAGHPIHKVKRMYAIARPLHLGRIFSSENLKWYEKAGMRILRLDRLDGKPSPYARPYEPRDLHKCLQMLEDYKRTVTLARVFEPEELAHELDYPDAAYTLVWEQGGELRGFINWAMVEHVGFKPMPWAWLNHICFGDMDNRERSELVRAFLIRAHQLGAAGVVEWAKNYYNKKPLWKNRFIPYPRSVDMLAWTFRPQLDLSGIPDVFEVQI